MVGSPRSQFEGPLPSASCFALSSFFSLLSCVSVRLLPSGLHLWCRLFLFSPSLSPSCRPPPAIPPTRCTIPPRPIGMFSRPRLCTCEFCFALHQATLAVQRRRFRCGGALHSLRGVLELWSLQSISYACCLWNPLANAIAHGAWHILHTRRCDQRLRLGGVLPVFISIERPPSTATRGVGASVLGGFPEFSIGDLATTLASAFHLCSHVFDVSCKPEQGARAVCDQ